MYYVRAVDITVLPTISSIVSEQASATENMEKKYAQLLDYLETHANTKIQYYALDMMLNTHSDT